MIIILVSRSLTDLPSDNGMPTVQDSLFALLANDFSNFVSLYTSNFQSFCEVSFLLVSSSEAQLCSKKYAYMLFSFLGFLFI